MPIDMIVCDLDGTLLRMDKTVSEYTLDVLHKCRARGVKFAIATARNLEMAIPFVDMLKPDVLIYQGGALAASGSQIVYSKPLDAKDAIAIMNGLLGRDDVTIIISEGEDYRTTGFAGRYPDKLHNISFGLKGSLGDFGKDFTNVGIIQYRGENLVRFAHIDATKWRAVQACAAQLGIDMANIAAFGDDSIDIDMIENCGIGVAMSNAIDEAKAVADFVCDTNDNDGVARWLEENF